MAWWDVGSGGSLSGGGLVGWGRGGVVVGGKLGEGRRLCCGEGGFDWGWLLEW